MYIYTNKIFHKHTSLIFTLLGAASASIAFLIQRLSESYFPSMRDVVVYFAIILFAIFGAIIDLSHGMGLLVVAEGVEREDQRKALIKHSCDQIQGYLISRPVSESEVCKLLEILN